MSKYIPNSEELNTEQGRTKIDVLRDSSKWSSPFLNTELGKTEPHAHYKRAGILAYQDGTNWNVGGGVKSMLMYDGSAWVAPCSTFGDIAGGNYSSFESDGTLKFTGNATVFDDMQIGAHSVKGGATAPTFAAYKGGINLYKFTDNAGGDESVHFTIQLSHRYKEGSDIAFHVHVVPSANGTAPNDVVEMGLEYQWVNVDGTFGGSNTTTKKTKTIGAADADKHLLFTGWTITGTSKTISSVLICRLFRATQSAATDTYPGDVWFISADAHYEIDTVGSRSATTK